MQTQKEKENAPGRCAAYFEKLSDQELKVFFQDAGLERLHGKAEKLIPEILKNGADHTFRHLLFVSSGNSEKNKANFAELFERLGKYEEELLQKEADAVIWGESGLLPADNSGENIHPDAREIVKDLWKKWWSIRRDARENIPVWTRGRVRPQSSPERKIAFLVAFIRTHSMQSIRDFSLKTESLPSEGLALHAEEFFLCKDPFWDSHTSFRAGKLKVSSSVSGIYRARTFAADVLFPVLCALALIRREPAEKKRIDQAYLHLPKQLSNAITRRFFLRAFREPARGDKVLNSAAERQGALHLWKQFCIPSKENCAECVFASSLFPKL